MRSTLGAPPPADEHRARVLRESDFDDASAMVKTARRGDVLLSRSYVWRVYGGPNVVEQKTARRNAYLNMLLLPATDPYADALDHYCDVLRWAEREFLAEYTSHNLRFLHLPLKMQVRPSDAGLAAAFCLQEADWLLCRQWQSITVVWYGAEWWIAGVDFGNGCCRVFENVGADLAPDLGASPTDAERCRYAIGARTRDLSRLVDIYRLTLKTWALTSLECTIRPSMTEYSRAINRIEAVLTSHDWWIVSPPSVVWRAELATRVTLMYVAGPVATFRCNEWQTAMSQIGNEFEWMAPVTIDSNLFIVDPETSNDQLEFFQLWHRTWSDPGASDLRRTSGLSPRPAHQWRSVHRLVLDAALALAPLRLPSYVVLWVLEWLPALRHHVHIQVFRLIESILASRSRVLAARPST